GQAWMIRIYYEDLQMSCGEVAKLLHIRKQTVTGLVSAWGFMRTKGRKAGHTWSDGQKAQHSATRRLADKISSTFASASVERKRSLLAIAFKDAGDRKAFIEVLGRSDLTCEVWFVKTMVPSSEDFSATSSIVVWCADAA